jgi:hypothetical protein
MTSQFSGGGFLGARTRASLFASIRVWTCSEFFDELAEANSLGASCASPDAPALFSVRVCSCPDAIDAGALLNSSAMYAVYQTCGEGGWVIHHQHSVTLYPVERIAEAVARACSWRNGEGRQSGVLA